MNLATKLEEALKATTTQAQDVAAVELARCYAALIDQSPENLEALGPKYLAVLESLGMTPKGRNVKGGNSHGPTTGDPARDALAELRARRHRDGAHRAEDLDAAAS